MPPLSADVTDAGHEPLKTALNGGSWTRYFGYDIFISFALGPPPRGSRSYASDLARKLRERGFTVFFSEDEAPVGNELGSTLRKALHRSRLLVIIANRGTLSDPRWVKTEVEEFLHRRPKGTIVTINIDGALQDKVLGHQTEAWLPFRGRIWIDDTEEACISGRVNDAVVDRLVTAPHAVRSLVRLRMTVGIVITIFAVVAMWAMVQRSTAISERDRAHEALLSSSAQQALLLSRDGRAQEGWAALLDALTEAQPAVDGRLPDGFLHAALTTLIENRRGPQLLFETSGITPPAHEEGDVDPPVFTFDSSGAQVAAAAGQYVAVWSTKDGRRAMQEVLEIIPESLTFAAQGLVLIAQGRAPVNNSDPESKSPARAVAIEIKSGKHVELPLRLCEGWVPCIASAAPPERLSPLSDLPAFDWTEVKDRTPSTGFLAAAVGNSTTIGTSINRFVLVQRERADRELEYVLLDRQTGAVKFISKVIGKIAFNTFTLASGAPLLVASSNMDPNIVVYNIIGGKTKGAPPSLVESHRMRAKLARGIKDVHLDAAGTTIRYQNYTYGTGTPVGIGETVVLELQSGRERWTRGEGNVAWGHELVALQENRGETHVMSAATGATWFVSPGAPLAFDPHDHMLLMWEVLGANSAHSWPQLQLLETLPISQFSHDLRGLASPPSICSKPRFLVLSERFDRIWNGDDWHRVSAAALPIASTAQDARAETVTSPQILRLKPKGDRWQVKDESQQESEDPPALLEESEVLHRYPLLAELLRSAQGAYVTQSVSQDGRWSGIVIEPDDKQKLTSCNGWAQWRLYRTGEPKPIRSGCTTGTAAGSEQRLEIQFLASPAISKTGPLAVIPMDICQYRIVQLEHDRNVADITPIFGNDVKFSLVAQDMLGITSTGWHGSPIAYQLQTLDMTEPGPVIIFAERNDASGDEDTLGAPQSPISTPSAARQVLFPLDTESSSEENGIEVSLDAGRSELRIADGVNLVTLGVPPWGKRLREKLRQDIESRKSNLIMASPQ